MRYTILGRDGIESSISSRGLSASAIIFPSNIVLTQVNGARLWDYQSFETRGLETVRLDGLYWDK